MHVAGLRELAQACRELPERVGRSALREATSAGAAVIREEAKARAPVYTGEVTAGHPPPGTLRKAVAMYRNNSASGPLKQVFSVGVRHGKSRQKVGKTNRDAYYWRFVEFGTAKMSARPFLRPAFEATKVRAVETIAAVLRQRIAKETLSLPRK